MITKDIVHTYHNWFNNYIEQFLVKYPDLSENIQIKAGHCKKVAKEIIGIARSLKLDEKEVLLAEAIGLFHDIGRFRQYVKYQTFSDSKSQNHAELGVEVLTENNVLKGLTEETKEIIYKSIINHSRAEILPDNNEKVIFYSKLVRDADKLDIWRLITEYYMVKEQRPACSADRENKTLELELPDSKDISDEVFQAILHKRVVLKESLKTLNDFKLLQIGWLFNLNFGYSVQRLYEKKYLEKIFETLPVNEKIIQIQKIVNEYFQQHIETFSIK